MTTRSLFDYEQESCISEISLFTYRVGYQRYSPKHWPSWSNESGKLTLRGHLLEKSMGKYFALWFQEKGFSIDYPKDVDVYTNNYERTISSGFAFIEGAFPLHTPIVRYANTSVVDPIFSLHCRNLTPDFENEIQNHMKDKLLGIDLRESFELLQNITDMKNSLKCKEEGISLLVDGQHTIRIVANRNPVLSGPLAVGNQLVDTFLMQYYNGFDVDDVAWGLVKNENDWKMLLDISKYCLDVMFNQTDIARDVSLPLVRIIKDYLFTRDIKLHYLVGHDANIFTMFRILNFKPYELPEQHEKTPTGGKIVFQKWFDRERDTHLLKVEYIYASFKQMRDIEELSLDNPPKTIPLEMEDCPVDNDGFCLWSDFVKKMIEF
ncbi:Glucose-1-phosphatase [Eumeta japonica]|uniref:Glucose-1-phosphatase n=1 Tax=Eumeta variegata TaxID=151549 RepID=A0A4C1VVU1_EUMVA|nr:Glucose-1-phosphatase [Eumeta japonica]